MHKFFFRLGSQFAWRGCDNCQRCHNFAINFLRPKFYVYFFQRVRTWSPTPGINTNFNRNNIFLKQVPKIIEVMFLLENPSTSPLPRPFPKEHVTKRGYLRTKRDSLILTSYIYDRKLRPRKFQEQLGFYMGILK